MNSLIARVHRGANWPLITLFLLPAFAVQYLLIAEYLPVFLDFSQGLMNPDQLFCYDSVYLEQLYRELGDPGRSHYKDMLRLDYLYMALAGIGYALLIAKLERKGTALIGLPLMMLIFDALENTLQIQLLNGYPSFPATWIELSSLASSLKMVMGLIAMLYLLLLIIRSSYRFMLNPKKSSLFNKEATQDQSP